MKLKLDENGKAEVQDGKPVYIDDAGKDCVYDVPQMVNKITQLNSEAKSHRERAQATEAKLKQFEGIDDPAEALKAIETVKNLDDKKLVDAGEVEKVKAEVGKRYDIQLADAADKYKKLETDFNETLISSAFGNSSFIAEGCSSEYPAPILRKIFGEHFKRGEDGRLYATDAQGAEIYSRSSPGEKAEFEEALSILVSDSPYAGTILVGSKASGTNSSDSRGGGGSNKSYGDCKTDQEKADWLSSRS